MLASQDEAVPSSLSTLPPASDSSGKVFMPESDTEDDEASPRGPLSNTPSPLKHQSRWIGLHGHCMRAFPTYSESVMLAPPRRKCARPRYKVSQHSTDSILCLFLTHHSVPSFKSLFFFFTAPSLLQAGTAGVSAGVDVSGIHLPTADIYTTSYTDNGTSNSNTMSDDGTSSGLQALLHRCHGQW